MIINFIAFYPLDCVEELSASWSAAKIDMIWTIQEVEISSYLQHTHMKCMHFV